MATEESVLNGPEVTAAVQHSHPQTEARPEGAVCHALLTRTTDEEMKRRGCDTPLLRVVGVKLSRAF